MRSVVQRFFRVILRLGLPGGRERLAEWAGLSVRTYIRGLNSLRSKGGWLNEDYARRVGATKVSQSTRVFQVRPEAFEAIAKETFMGGGVKMGWGLQVQSMPPQGKVNLKNREGDSCHK
jgi:hypothetical protein